MDSQIRNAAFEWLNKQEQLYGDVLSRTLLEKGFVYNGQQINLLGPKGIWRPKAMSFPLSITTVFDGPYADALLKNNLLQYSYRGADPYHFDNIGLRDAMKQQIPLIYFFGIDKGRYLVTKPVYIIEDNMDSLFFTVAVDEMLILGQNKKKSYDLVEEESETYIRRSYITSNLKVRLHQRSFRERVLRAYNNQCTLCKLRHTELLDAAHIIPDVEKEGLPMVQNGLSLCKIHHAAFDRHIIGITPDYNIKIRKDILEESNGPMLKYGIQSLENQRLILPNIKKNWPDKERLDMRYKLFLKAI